MLLSLLFLVNLIHGYFMKINKFILLSKILIVLFIFNLNTLCAARPHRAYSIESSLEARHPNVRAVILQLKRMPESNEVIRQALGMGSITVEMSSKGMPFNAMWENYERRIVVDKRASKDQGSLLCHLLFELTNAVAEPRYQELCELAIDGLIDCDSYVEAVERIEYENMVRTVAIIEKGISSGIFPSTAGWEVIHDFDIHYKIQQLAGHSLLIAKEYQEITGRKRFSSYQGTVKNLKRMSHSEKMSLIEYLSSQYFHSKRKISNA